MRNFLNEYFHYTRSERNGFIVLLSICIFFALFPSIYRTLYPLERLEIKITGIPSVAKKEKKTISKETLFPFDPNTASLKELSNLGLSNKIAQRILNYRAKGGSFSKKQDFKKIYGLSEADYLALAPYIEIESIAQSIPNDIPSSYNKPTTKTPPPPVKLFPFDPNTATKKDFLRLGLKERVANTILKFRSKGNFKNPEDFQKIFGLSQQDYLKLKPFIVIQKDTLSSTTTKSYAVSEKTKVKAFKKPIIDINLAAVEEWQLLYGIGLSYAKRIVEYRTNLGGFQDIQQVAEVYGITDSTFQNILPQLTLSSKQLVKMNINTADVASLKKHPYLKWKHAQIIVNYRENHGPYQSLDDVRKIRAFDSTFVQKISPYLSFD